MQVKLLRVLGEKVRPVGATEEGTVDTRVSRRRIAIWRAWSARARSVKISTHIGDPDRAAALRERAEDISDLATHFVQKFCAPTGQDAERQHECDASAAVFVAGQRTRLEHDRARGCVGKDPARSSPSVCGRSRTTIRIELRRRWSFRTKGSTLRPIWTNSKRRMCSRRFAARQVIRRMPLSCSGLSVRSLRLYWTNTASAADRTDARRASWSRLAPAPPLLRSSRGAVKKTRANSPPAPAKTKSVFKTLIQAMLP